MWFNTEEPRPRWKSGNMSKEQGHSTTTPSDKKLVRCAPFFTTSSSSREDWACLSPLPSRELSREKATLADIATDENPRKFRTQWKQKICRWLWMCSKCCFKRMSFPNVVQTMFKIVQTRFAWATLTKSSESAGHFFTWTITFGSKANDRESTGEVFHLALELQKLAWTEWQKPSKQEVKVQSTKQFWECLCIKYEN